MADKHEKKKNTAPPEEPAPKAARKAAVRFRQEETPEQKQLSRRERRRLIVTLAAVVVLLAAAIVVWSLRDRFVSDDLAPTGRSSAPTADAEYIFDTSSGQCFASAGRGLAVATTSGLELLNADGQVAASHLFQMSSPAIAAGSEYAVFYDVGGNGIVAAFFDGTVRELTPAGNIFSATVSSGGYLALTTEAAGYRGLVTVYNAQLEPVYQWYSSSAWIISAEVSPDNRSLAVLSYTSSGSEVRLFDLNKTEQQAAFSVSDTILLDTHWFSTSQLCAYSADQALFFDGSGKWTSTFSFDGKFLVSAAFGEGFAAFALSPYRAGTTATLYTLDAGGRKLGSADIQSELVSLAASGTEVLVLCPDSVILYSSSLSEKGHLNGLTGFKYGLLRSRGEAILIASGYAEIHTF